MAIYIYHYEVRPRPEVDFLVSVSGSVYPPLPSQFGACATLTFALQTGDVFPTREQVEAIWQITGIWEDEFTYMSDAHPTSGLRRFRRRKERYDDY